MLKDLPGNFFENRLRVYAALLLPALLMYCRSFWFGFSILDEQYLITESVPVLNDWHNIVRLFTVPVVSVYYRPLLMLSIMLDYQVGGISPYIYHVTNLLLHLLSVALLYRLLGFFAVEKKTAFILALLFSVHPVMVHAVVWVPGRNDLLLCLFMLLSLLYLNKYLLDTKNKFILLHLLFFACALLTKENAIVLPLVYAANIYVQQRAKPFRFYLVMLLLWALVSAGWLLMRNAAIGAHATDTGNMQETLRNFIPAFLLYTGKALVPWQQSVFPTLQNASLVPGILTVMLLTVLWFKPGLKNKKTAALGLLIFFILLLIPVWFGAARRNGEHYEHRMYASMAGLILFLSQLRFNTGAKWVMYAFAVLVIGFIIKTSVRMNVYKDKATFIDAGVSEAPQYYLFQYKKAELLFGAKDYRTALVYCTRAVEARPDRSELYCNRGAVYLNLNMPEAAIADFSKAISLLPEEARYYLSRCTAYTSIGDTVKAMADFIMVRKLDAGIIPPDVANTVTNNWALLIERMNRKINADPANAQLYYQRAALYTAVQMQVNARADLEKAKQLE